MTLSRYIGQSILLRIGRCTPQNSDEAKNLRNFVDLDLQLLEAKKKLILCAVSESIINQAKLFIPQYNLFASDALHLATAVIENSTGLLVDDYHFTRLDTRIRDEEEQIIWPTLLEVEEFLSKLHFSS